MKAGLGFFLTAKAAAAEVLAQVRLPAVPQALPGLTIMLEGGLERALSIQELEALGTWRLRTTSPWDEGEISVEGPLLRDVLAHVGLAQAERIVVRSADAYAPTIPQEDWRDFPVVLATRLDGQPLGRRHKGPTRIIYPLLEYPQLKSPQNQARWVWLISSIEAVD